MVCFHVSTLTSVWSDGGFQLLSSVSFGSVTGSSVNMAAVGVASRQLLPVLFVVALFTYVFFKNVLNSSALGLPIAPKYLSHC